jgi:hypothetical protein
MERCKKLTLLHSNDMHGDLLACNTDGLVAGAMHYCSSDESSVKSLSTAEARRWDLNKYISFRRLDSKAARLYPARHT